MTMNTIGTNYDNMIMNELYSRVAFALCIAPHRAVTPPSVEPDEMAAHYIEYTRNWRRCKRFSCHPPGPRPSVHDWGGGSC